MAPLALELSRFWLICLRLATGGTQDTSSTPYSQIYRRSSLHCESISYTAESPGILAYFRFCIEKTKQENVFRELHYTASPRKNPNLINYKDEKLIYPAANRNKEPILQALKRFVYPDPEKNSFFLEVSSGSGQHVAHFAPAFPQVTFQPSEYDKSLFPSITHYAKHCPTKNIQPPIYIDITKPLINFGINENSLDYIYNANMIHISPYHCTIGLFENAGRYLKPEALLITYGPYAKDGVLSPESNVSFNESLKSRDPAWGIRDINDLVKLGKENNISLIDTIEMPSNNKTLIWKRD